MNPSTKKGLLGFLDVQIAKRALEWISRLTIASTASEFIIEYLF